MGSRQFKSTDTEYWTYRYGSGAYDATISGNETHGWDGSTRFQANGIFSGTAGQTSFTKPAGWTHTGLCLLHQTQGTNAGQWELSNVNFSGASAVADKPLQNTYGTGAQIITLSNGTTGYHNVTINNGVTLSAPAWNGTTGGIVAILANGTVTVTGAINANGNLGAYSNSYSGTGFTSGGGFRGGQGLHIHSDTSGGGYQGEGVSGGMTQTTSNSANAAGGGYTVHTGAGGGDHYGAVGGGGGNGTAGYGTYIHNGNTAGTNGAGAGNANLTIIVFGGGGGGAVTQQGDQYNAGAGGSGGGIVFIISKTINITGNITATGGKGGDGNYGGQGGGGAGGSILIKGQNITLGSNLITAAGGVGGNRQNDYFNFIAGIGGVGRIHADWSQSITGSTSPTLDSTKDTTLAEIGNFFAFF